MQFATRSEHKQRYLVKKRYKLNPVFFCKNKKTQNSKQYNISYPFYDIQC